MINLSTAKKLDKLLNEEWKCKDGKVEPNKYRSIEELLEKLPVNLTIEKTPVSKYCVYTPYREQIKWHKNLAEALARLLIKLKEETK